MTSPAAGDGNRTEHERFGRTLEERNAKIGEALADRAGIDLDAYADVDPAELGRTLVSGGPLSHPAADAYADLDEAIARDEIRPRIDDDLIAEHADTPIGQHSDDLQRVLTYFRRQPAEDKYAIVELEKDETWQLAKTTGVRGEPPELVGEDTYDSQEAAEHALFRRRVADLRDTTGEEP